MNRPLVILTCGVLLLAIGLAGWHLIGSAESSPQLLTGELWQNMSPDAKVAFVWGIGNLVEFERAQTGASPAGSKSFLPLLTKGLSGKPINEVVRQVDAYYQAHPDQLKRPVVDAIFQAVVLPTVKAEMEGGKVK
ncbi:MAG: hypothetical protein HYY85_09010 [Deltaproteobacteria bacterium]|nr:hypothetical protein [Deltaproteobacteria bacterium]